MELTSYLTKSTHNMKWLVSWIKFRLIVHADVRIDRWTFSFGYLLLNEMTNVKIFKKCNMNSRLYKMGQTASSFSFGISTQRSHSQSLDPLNIFARFLFKLTSHPGPSWLPLWYFFLFSEQSSQNVLGICSVLYMLLHFTLYTYEDYIFQLGEKTGESIICNVS